MNVPLPPPSKAAPPKALSVQCIGKTERTPRARALRIPRSMSALVHCGTPIRSLQPNRFDDSIPIRTASLPRSIARRAWRGL